MISGSPDERRCITAPHEKKPPQGGFFTVYISAILPQIIEKWDQNMLQYCDSTVFGLPIQKQISHR